GVARSFGSFCFLGCFAEGPLVQFHGKFHRARPPSVDTYSGALISQSNFYAVVHTLYQLRVLNTGVNMKLCCAAPIYSKANEWTLLKDRFDAWCVTKTCATAAQNCSLTGTLVAASGNGFRGP